MRQRPTFAWSHCMAMRLLSQAPHEKVPAPQALDYDLLRPLTNLTSHDSGDHLQNNCCMDCILKHAPPELASLTQISHIDSSPHTTERLIEKQTQI
mmetsp:Transcript_7582/g.14451  ORF Transcript_7582/g.14451 Transcript_7582/m.14451 type:complete len:96 (+) Transcript_7582:75-362(+)